MAEAVERAPQVGAGLALVAIGPEQGGQGVTALRLARDGKVDQQRQGAPQAELDRFAVMLQSRWAEDKEIVKGLVEKTVKSYDGTAASAIQLHTLSINWEEDREFVETLYNKASDLEQPYKELIANNTRNWEVDRPASDLKPPTEPASPCYGNGPLSIPCDPDSGWDAEPARRR